VDLAGFEDITTRAHYFREDFRAVHRCGLALTVHAGENDDAEGIWSAVFDLNARRIGHALSLGESPDLLRSVADRRIGIEMCPFANLQIKGFPLDDETFEDPQSYPLLRYLQAGVPVTVNTDNIGISAATLTGNFLLLPRLCPGITRLHVLQLLRNSLDQSFLASSDKSQLLSEMKINH
jgi:adenosine deaminase